MEILLRKDVLALIIFAVSVVIFVIDKLPMATTAILGCAAMVIFGVCDFSVAFGEFASNTVIMLIAIFIVGAAISETGLAKKIGGLITGASGDSERILLAISYLIAAGLSTFLSNVTVLAIFIPIIFGIAATSGGKIDPKNLILPITIASNMGGITTLVGSSQQMTAQGLLESYNLKGFSVFDFTPMGLILIFAGLLFCLFIGYPIGKKIWGDRETDESDFVLPTDETSDGNRGKMITVSVIFIIMILLYIFGGIPFTNIVIKPAVTAVISALAVICTGCITQKKAVLSVNWNIVGRLGGCLGLAKALDAAGSIDLVSKFLGKVGISKMSPLLIFIIVCVLSEVLSWFISNSTAISVFLLIIIAVSPSLSLNVPAFAMAITLSASMGACCPLSGSTYGVAMSAGYRFRDFFKYGIIYDLLCLVLIIIFVPIFFGGITC